MTAIPENDFSSTAARQRLLRRWFATALGSSLCAEEARRLDAVLPQLYGTVALQLGHPGGSNLLASSPVARRIVLDVGEGAVVAGVPEQLPFASKCIHVALLPHTLDFCADPHAVLREVTRVLVPEGHAVILGFNPFSLWGLRRMFSARPRAAPWCGHFHSLHRIKDWLALLDFEITHGSMLYYGAPVQRDSLRERLRFLDPAGDRWWPLMAAAYLLVARKRVAGVTPLPLHWKARRLVGTPVARPTTRGMVLPFACPVSRRLG